MINRPETIEEWRTSISNTIERLKLITTQQFFDEKTLQYDPECTALVWIGEAFEKDIEQWNLLMASRQNWKLPLDPTAIASLAPTEIYYRLSENIAGERFMDGILVDPFESGSLVAALGKLLHNLDSFKLAEH